MRKKPKKSKTKGRETMKNRKGVFIISLALILLVCAAASTSVVLGRMNPFLLDDAGAIPIVLEEAVPAREVFNIIPAAETGSALETENPSADNTPSAPETEDKSDFEVYPGFTVVDENDVVWGTETNVEIFKVSYENGEGVITVKSDNVEKVVAPGTDNSYTFKLKKTGNVPVEYWLDVDAYITPGDMMIPIEGRINRYDGQWIVGGMSEWVEVPAIDTAADQGTLGAGKYTYYTLDWRWPFESGNDEYDTLLGNLAVEEDITITIVIKTIAMATDDPGRDDGITPPDTGDNSILSLWIALAVGCVVLMVILLVYLYREKKRSESEALRN